MLIHVIGTVIDLYHPTVTDLICSLIYTKRISEDHLPHFLMMSHSALDNFRAMDLT